MQHETVKKIIRCLQYCKAVHSDKLVDLEDYEDIEELTATDYEDMNTVITTMLLDQ